MSDTKSTTAEAVKPVTARKTKTVDPAPAATLTVAKAKLVALAKTLPQVVDKANLKKGVDKARATLESAKSYSKANAAAVATSAAAASKGARTLSVEGVNYQAAAFNKGLAAAKSLSDARSMHEAVGLYGEFTKSAYEMQLGELSKMSAILSMSYKEAYSPLKARLAKTWPYSKLSLG